MHDKAIRHNPILKKMGFGPNDRVVVIHADDVGMCDTTLTSFAELVDFGIVSSGSVMVPCPAFEATADWALQNPHADLGVHLTLTSEWDEYRWGPVTPQNKSSGMIDDEGYFHKTCPPLWEHANLPDIYNELKGQIEKARDAGMDISHLDSHMFSCMVPHFFSIYYQLGQEFEIPLLLKRGIWTKQDPNGLNTIQVEAAENIGLPIFDHLFINSLRQSVETCLETAKNIFDNMPPGLSYYIIHPAKGNEEMQSIASDWKGRDADYQVFKDFQLKKHIKQSNVNIISFQDLVKVL